MLEMRHPTNQQIALRTAIFLGITFLINWGMIAIFVALGGKWGSPTGLLVALAYMLVPGLTAIVVQRAILKEPVIGPLGLFFRMNWWLLIAWLLPVALALLALGVTLFLPGQHLSPTIMIPPGTQLPPQAAALLRHPGVLIVIVVVSGLTAGATINAFFALGEELGWRGFLLRQFAPLGFWRASLLIGVTWGVWHAPVILLGHNYPQHPRIGVAMMTLFTVLFTPLLIYVRVRARSVLAAAISHGTLNGVAGLPLLLVAGGSDLTKGLTGLAGMVTLVIANLVLVVYDRYCAQRPLMGWRGTPNHLLDYLSSEAISGAPNSNMPK